MSVAGCCCGPQEQLPCSSCYGGNPCYTLQPAPIPPSQFCQSGDGQRKYRLNDLTSAGPMTFFHNRTEKSTFSFSCPYHPCQAWVLVCTSCYPCPQCELGGTNWVAQDLCTGPMQQVCARSGEMIQYLSERGRPHKVHKEVLDWPHFTMDFSGPQVLQYSCGAPLTFPHYKCWPPGNGLPCSMGNPCGSQGCSYNDFDYIGIDLCNYYTFTVAGCEESPSHEWLHEEPAAGTLELTINCNAGTGPFGFTMVAGSGNPNRLGGGYYRRIATTLEGASVTCPPPYPVKTNWGHTGISADVIGYPQGWVLNSTHGTGVTTRQRGSANFNCSTGDAIMLTFKPSAYSVFVSPDGTVSNPPTEWSHTITGIYYGCPDLDVYGTPNPQYKNRLFKLDRWTIPTRLHGVRMGFQYVDYTCCGGGAGCGQWTCCPLSIGGSCWSQLQGAALEACNLLRGVTPMPLTTIKQMGELYCVSDDAVPPPPAGDEYGCWFGAGHEATPIPRVIELERQGSW